MQRNFLLALFVAILCLAATGCQNPARQQLLGTWQAAFEMNDDELKRLTPVENPLVAAIGQSLLRSLKAEIELQLRDDGSLTITLSMFGTKVRRDGTWQFVAARDGEVTIAVQMGDESQAQQWTLTFQDEQTFRTAPQAGQQWQFDRLLTFRRAGEKS